DGVNLDSKDHKSHLAYPDLVMEGSCPLGFDSRVLSLYYETIWNTSAFRLLDGSFLLSNGDRTGFSYYSDFLNRWNIEVLQQAITSCTNLSGRLEDCSIFNIQLEQSTGQC
ncbi:uncharacterized protein BDR25DRAFT_169878, partial [Lindgomyces ingoldianus]